MPIPFSLRTVVWRILLLRNGANEVLALETERGLYLPEIEIPEGCRVARSLNQAVKEKWDLTAYSLFPFCPPELPGCRFYAVEALESDAPAPQSSRWLSLDSIDPSCLSDPEDFGAIRGWRDKVHTLRKSDSSEPFATPGWLPSCQDWISQALESLPLKLTGGFLQCNASPTFSLIRFETDRTPVWFKAVGEPNLREYAITPLLCSEVPAFMPRLLGTKPEWHGWVTLEADGVPLSQTNDFGYWRQAVRDLAAMQKESCHLADEILRTGARDVRTHTLVSQIEMFLSMVKELMACQVQEQPRRLTDAEIVLLEEDLRLAFATLLHDGVSDSVLHLDLHPDNVIALDGRTVFLDWAETGVGHPFLSFAYFLEHFRRQFTDADRGLETLTREYLSVWNLEDSRDIAKTLPACALVALFAYAVSIPMDRNNPLRDQNRAGFCRSLARRMKRYGERTRSEALSFREVIA